MAKGREIPGDFPTTRDHIRLAARIRAVHAGAARDWDAPDHILSEKLRAVGTVAG